MDGKLVIALGVIIVLAVAVGVFMLKPAPTRIITMACSDGTLESACSSDQPKFCSGGALSDACGVCGCPAGYSCSASGACVSGTPSTICSDGTMFGRCSPSRPKFCANGTLEDRCGTCGCPADYVCDSSTGACTYVPPTPKCSDGTDYGECSATKPQYCENGTLVNRCSACGCASGLVCGADGSCHDSRQCSDGTPYGECSSTQGSYCNAGALINRCYPERCGCPANNACSIDPVTNIGACVPIS